MWLSSPPDNLTWLGGKSAIHTVDDIPTKTWIYCGFPIAMFDYWRVQMYVCAIEELVGMEESLCSTHKSHQAVVASDSDL